jgi:metal-sulfur cluster biosynthetic enzyme
MVEKVKSALQEVMDPGTNLDVWNMRLIKDLTVDEKKGIVNLTFKPSSPNCPLAFKLGLDIKKKLKEIKGVSEVNIEVEGFINSKQLKEVLASE